MIDLSICIPTYNRVKYLKNCLNSILIACENSSLKIEVCISDNCSDEDTYSTVKEFEDKINIVFNQNAFNIGLGNNILKSVSIAKGEFAWILGNDDLVLPNSFKIIEKLIKNNLDVNFYYINSFHLNKNIIDKFDTPLDTRKIDFTKLKRFSDYKKSKKQEFFELINPLKSFEFMLSMYLCIFKKKYWVENVNVIDKKNISDATLYSNFDNTAPHIKIWSAAFNNKISYFLHEPLSANVHGPRDEDWGNLYAFVEAVRIPEVLDCYRNNGMSFLRFFICKNYALRRFLPGFYKMILKPKHKGLEYVKIWSHVIKNSLYPGVYIFGFYFFFRRLFIIVKNLF